MENKNTSLDIKIILRDYANILVPPNGGNFECPLHDDSSKNSMKLYSDTNTVHCFGACSKTYNPVTLVAAIKGTNINEAYQEINKKYVLEPLTPEEEEKIFKLKLLDTFVQEAKSLLSQEHRNYLYERGLSDDDIDKLCIGYVPNDVSGISSLSENEMKDLGIIYSISAEGIASNFTNKIVIPLYDSEGSLVYAAAWNYSKIEGEPKYAYPKDMKKQVVGDIVTGSTLVEGVFDLISMQKSGYKAFSFLGVRPTRSQLDAIRNIKDIKILYDADEAGEKVADEIAKELYPAIKVIRLPKGYDPNSYYIEVGTTAFCKYINTEVQNSKDYLDSKVETLLNMENKRQAVNFLNEEIVPLLVRLSTTEQEMVISEIIQNKKKFGVTKAAIKDQIKAYVGTVSPNSKEDSTNLATEFYEALKGEIELFIDSRKVTYARFEVNDHYETHSFDSEVFKRHIQRRSIDIFGKLVGKDTLSTVRDILESDAFFDGVNVEMENRIARDTEKNELYYDMSDRTYRVVKITENGWDIMNYPKPLFKREDHQAPQVEPDPNGDINLIFKLFKHLDSKQRLLYLVFLVYSFIAKVPKVVLYVQGEKGAGKSDFTKATRQLIDPSAIDSLKEPSIEDRVVQQLQHHYVSLFDNVNVMKDWFVRLCCTAVTGESDEKRKLFTDEGTVIFSYLRVIIINAINRLGISFPDFQERLLLFKLSRISEKDRMDREEFWDVYHEIKPKVLGGIFNILCKSIKIKPTIKLESKPRMADFATWGCAITEALGYIKEDFLAAYYENMREANEEMVDNHPIANAIDEFMKGKTSWKGKSSKLMEELEDIAVDLHIDTKQTLWPKSPSSLSMRINEITSNLLDIGIEVTKGQDSGSNASRFIEFKCKPERVLSTVNTEGPNFNNSPDILNGTI